MSSDFMRIGKGLSIGGLSADPSDGVNGDIYYNEIFNVFRKFENGAWSNMDTGGSGSTFVYLFKHKLRFSVRAASTTNVNINTQLENGDTFGGVTLVTGDFVLLKNQTLPEENGIYVVPVAGPATRLAAFDTADELTYAKIYVTAGTNAFNVYWQTAVLTTLSDPQTWGTTAPVYSFVVPIDKTSMAVWACAGGGGGGQGRAGNDGANQSGSGGGGGASAYPLTFSVPVVPGETITVTVGVGGSQTTAGSASIISGSFGTITLPGANGGAGGGAGFAATPGGSAYATPNLFDAVGPGVGGNGGAGAPQPGTGAAGQASASRNIFASTSAPAGASGGTAYAGGGGGAGAPGMGIGGSGGAGGNFPAAGNGVPGGHAPENNFGAGGGGGGGGREVSGGGNAGGRGGFGADGFVRVSL